jgi:hypothetical protein
LASLARSKTSSLKGLSKKATAPARNARTRHPGVGVGAARQRRWAWPCVMTAARSWWPAGASAAAKAPLIVTRGTCASATGALRHASSARCGGAMTQLRHRADTRRMTKRGTCLRSKDQAESGGTAS